MFEVFGTDLTQLTSGRASVLLGFLATVGTDVLSWPTENHFVSWLGYAPNPQISASSRAMFYLHDLSYGDNLEPLFKH